MCSAMQAESHKEYLRAGSQLRNQLIALCQGLHELGDALLQLALLLQGHRQLRLQLSSCVLSFLQLRLHPEGCRRVPPLAVKTRDVLDCLIDRDIPLLRHLTAAPDCKYSFKCTAQDNAVRNPHAALHCTVRNGMLGRITSPTPCRLKKQASVTCQVILLGGIPAHLLPIPEALLSLHDIPTPDVAHEGTSKSRRSRVHRALAGDEYEIHVNAGCPDCGDSPPYSVFVSPPCCACPSHPCHQSPA